jgi:hypothetical protein
VLLFGTHLFILLVGKIIPTEPSRSEDDGTLPFSEFVELLKEVI